MEAQRYERLGVDPGGSKQRVIRVCCHSLFLWEYGMTLAAIELQHMATLSMKTQTLV